jgi:aspartyl-tRNA(Asn)/glutamyl-tRNA(Gln) amidotransferase subunit A
MELCYMSVEELAPLIRDGQVSPVEVTQAHLDRIAATEPKLNAFITLTAEQALADAAEAETEIRDGRYRGPLHGISLGLKDLYYTEGVVTTSGVRIYEDFVPDYDSTVTRRLSDAGTILLGKLNLAPLAMSGRGENPFFGDALNPWDKRMVPGGSSSGSGVAAAAGQCTITMGSDTGGSIRIPASFCNLVGHKPTYGLVSRYGVSPLSWGLDHCGPMTRTVMDTAHAMNAIAGHDPNDPTSARVEVPDYAASARESIRGLRIGMPREFFEFPMESEVRSTVEKAMAVLEELGAELVDVSWPNFYRAVTMGHLISISEASSIHSHLVETRGSEEVTRILHKFPRIEAGMMISAADYLEVLKLRRNYTQESHQVMKDVDLLVGPTMPMTPFPLASAEVNLEGTTFGAEKAIPTFTRPYDLNGFPAVSVPCGFSESGLPIGLQIAAKPYQDHVALRAAYAYEQASEWHKRRPNLD